VTVKKTAILLALAAMVLALVLAPTVALANMGPHGGYLNDTDLCAECHRAHTAPSSVTWTDNQGAPRNALLLTNAASMEDFCLACHDNTSQGADTNVLDGIYEGTLYGDPNVQLLGGFFGRPNGVLPGMYAQNGTQKVTSTHMTNGESWGAYGGGTFSSASTQSADANGNAVTLLGTGAKIVMDCSSCHDPHGTSNYRLLKAVVYGVPVGGYDGGGAPTPFVLSREQGFPQGGFALHTPYPGYVPNYTSAKYAIAPGSNQLKGMSGWCTGCHTTYMTKSGNTYNAGDGYGYVPRYRHPINVPMSNFQGPQAVVATLSVLPLAHVDGAPGGVVGNGSVTQAADDWIECLTCHNSHGSSMVMTGWANVADPANDLTVDTGIGGVPPTNDSALLKLKNRGVCEVCHDK
jgi:cytochrome c553